MIPPRDLLVTPGLICISLMTNEIGYLSMGLVTYFLWLSSIQIVYVIEGQKFFNTLDTSSCQI